MGSWITFISWTHWTNNSGFSLGNICKFSLFCPTHVSFHSPWEDVLFIFTFETTVLLFVCKETLLFPQLQTFACIFILELSFISSFILRPLFILFWTDIFCVCVWIALLYLLVIFELLIFIWFCWIPSADKPKPHVHFCPDNTQVHFCFCADKLHVHFCPDNPHVHFCFCADKLHVHFSLDKPQLHWSIAPVVNPWLQVHWTNPELWLQIQLNSFLLELKSWLHVHLRDFVFDFWFNVLAELSVILLLVVIFWLKYS